MNVGDIATRVYRQFGDESGAQIDEDDVIRWVNDAQMDIVRRTEILQKESPVIPVVADDDEYDPPADFMFARRITLDGYLLRRTSIEEMDAYEGNREADGITGSPDRYYLRGLKIVLYPIPEAAGDLVVLYVRQPVTVTGVGDIPEIPLYMHEDIVRYCLQRAKELNEDFEQAGIIGADYEQRTNKAREESQSSHGDSYPAVRLLPGDD